MNYLYRYLVGGIALLSVIGCTTSPVSGPEKTVTVHPDAGQFGLSHLANLNRKTAGAGVQEGENVHFDLGKIRGSTGFYFLLYNIGSTPITDVSLSVANNAFPVFPTSIDTLQPGSDVGMLPIVKVSAFHGTPYDGVGNRPLLPKGDNTFTLVISGKSKTAGGNDTVVELRAQMALTALVMDFSIAAPSGDIPMHSTFPHFFQSMEIDLPEIVLKKVNQYSVPCQSDTVFTLSNTGNVPLHITVYNCIFADNTIDMDKHNTTFLKDTVVEEGTSIDLDSRRYSNQNPSTVLIISGDNTVCDPSHLILDDNGKCYLQVFASPILCSEGTTKSAWTLFVEGNSLNVGDDCSGIFALIDSSMIFFAGKCPDGVPDYGLYEYPDNFTVLCRVTGSDHTKCTDSRYSDLMDTIITHLEGENPNVKALGLEQGRISQGSTVGVPWDSIK